MAVEGYGRAIIEDEEGILKGRFSFRFRIPDLGRIEALDPLNRTAYFVIIRDDAAYFVVPSKKAYALDRPESLFGRLLGFPLGPGEAVSLLSDRWEGRQAESGAPGWTILRDSEGRAVRGEKDGLLFEVLDFFEKANVPRTLSFSEGQASGRVTVLSLRFNPPPRPEAFDTGFVGAFVRLTWEELQELMRDED